MNEGNYDSDIKRWMGNLGAPITKKSIPLRVVMWGVWDDSLCPVFIAEEEKI